MGGAQAVLGWDAATASSWQRRFVDRCVIKARSDLYQSLQNGKYGFLLAMIPDFDSPRPISISLGNLAGRSLYR